MIRQKLSELFLRIKRKLSAISLDRDRTLIILFIISTLSFIYMSGGKVPYMLFYVALILPLISFIYCFFVFFMFKYNQDIDKHYAVKGEKIHFLLSIHNETVLFYPYIKIKFCNSDKIFTEQFYDRHFSLLPLSAQTLSFELDCKYRGSYDIGIEYIQIEDFTGALKLRYKLQNHHQITVSPRVIHLERFFDRINYISESNSTLSSKYEDSTVISEIRKYAYGDSNRKIHWKLSARLNQLMVKKFQSTTESNIILMVDLKQNSYSPSENIIIEDKVIESSASLLHFCLVNWIRVNFVYYHNDIKDIEAKTPQDFDLLYDILARMTFTAPSDISGILKLYTASNTGYTSIVVFTSNLNHDTYRELCNAKLAGYDPTIVYISPEEVTGMKLQDEVEIFNSLDEHGIITYKINIHDDIKQVLEGNGGLSA